MSDRLKLAAVVVAALSLGVAYERSQTQEGAYVAFLAVGQGDCTAIVDDGMVTLIDAGPSTDDFDAGRRLVVPQLKALGIKKIDCLIVTHPDRDHVGGLAAVAGQFRIGKVVASSAFRADEEMIGAFKKSGIRPRQVEWIDAAASFEMGSFSFSVFAPPSSAATEANEASLFVKVASGPGTMAFTGDANSSVEAQMRGAADWDVQVLKAGHHGSRFSTSYTWLLDTTPETIVVSCGRGNTYGHPAPAVIERARSVGAEVFRTDRDGTVVFVPSDSGFVRRR